MAKQLKEGQVIKVRTRDRGIVTGTITGFGEKNDQVVIDYNDTKGEGWWCYMDQVQ